MRPDEWGEQEAVTWLEAERLQAAKANVMSRVNDDATMHERLQQPVGHVG